MDQKTSVLVLRQVPEFVREEYPLFINFLEAYYEFLEEQQGIQLNDLLNQRQRLLTIFDVDKSIDEFTIQFFNTFANFFPLDVSVRKEFLIKNVLPLYKARGSEKSFALLFKILYGVDVEIEYPKNNILIASDGKWKVENSIKISLDISSTYVGDGETTEFTILKCNCPILDVPTYRQLTVYVDSVLQEEGTDYYVLKEYYKIIFNSAIADGSILEIFYENVDQDLFVNRKLIGAESGASVIAERIVARILNNRLIYELYVDAKTLVGEFISGENILTNVFVNDELINVVCKTISELKSINITNGGSGYKLTDTIAISALNSETAPKAYISKVSAGLIDFILPTNGGAGFQTNRKIYVNDLGLPLVDIDIVSITMNPSYPIYSPNTLFISSDIISDIDPANTIIDVEDYGFLGYSANANVNTVIYHTFSNTAFYDMGMISGITLNYVNLDIIDDPVFDAEPAKVTVANTEISIRDFGTLGKLEIANAGINYVVGDEIEFINADKSWGLGAFAEITQVSANGEIESVEFVPAKISGTANVSNTIVVVTGTGTLFNNELIVGNEIRINGENKTVVEITSNTALNVNSAFANTATNKPIRLFGKYLLGGQGYTQDLLPTANIISSTGESGEILVTAIFGDGDEYSYQTSNSIFGQIQEIVVTNYGKSITSIPEIVVSGGNNDAVLEPIMYQSYGVYPGKWINSDGIISSSAIRLQDRDYYHKFSYVISSIIEFSKYKDIVKNLLHPTGLRVYGKYNKMEEIDVENYLDIESSVEIS
jgi:hypothetical protein